MRKLIYIIPIILFLVSSCDDLIEIKPQGVIITEDALQDATDMQELLNSSYDVLRGNGGDFLGGRIQTIAEVMGDNIDGGSANLNNADFLAYYNKTTGIFTGYTQAMFGEPYIAIYRANVLLANLNVLEGSADAARIAGEAKFLRALCHFELVRLFAQPYGYTADNSHLGVVLRTEASSEAFDRHTVGEVYTQIVADLEDAVGSLPTTNDVYATSWAAKALLSKVYFHMHDFQNAYDLADDVIENGPHDFNTAATEYDDRFNTTVTQEAIFYMISFANDNRGPQFLTHYRSDAEAVPTLKASRDLYDEAQSEQSDLRNAWYDIQDEGAENEVIFFTKFDGNDFIQVPLIHVTEMKFIRAEAGAELNTTTELAVALADVNDIRTRAGLSTLSSLSQTSLLSAIRDEKRLELVGEGHRFHDLRRRGANGESSLQIRGSDWDCPGMSVQFPDDEISGAGGTDHFTPNETGGC